MNTMIIRLTAAAVAVLLVLGAEASCVAQPPRARLHEKIERVKSGISSMVRVGKDPAAALSHMERAKRAFDAGDVKEGEACVDAALKLTSGYASQAAARAEYSLPSYSTSESFVDLYGPPERVTIQGYDQECMEPMVTGDGGYLFFNNSNAENVSTHIHMAKRVSANLYKYLRIVPGTVSKGKDMAPTMDDRSHFYFTSTRSYQRDQKSLYVGRFAQEKLAGADAVTGDIWPTLPGAINMDCGISGDGQTLIFSRAHFDMGAPAPKQSDLMLAKLQNGKFVVAPNSDKVLKSINTPALEYAPELSRNGLELYFTRAGQLMVDHQVQGSQLRIMVATRRTRDEPFQEPRVIKSITGFVEAPTLTADLKELFFHRKENGKCHIARARRKK